MEKTLRLLFDEGGREGPVREFLMRTFGRVRSGKVALPEFVFAREFRGASGYRPTAVVPALKLAQSRLLLPPLLAPWRVSLMGPGSGGHGTRGVRR